MAADRQAWGPPVADASAVLLFVLLGRSSHEEGSAVLGTLATAWPFLTGAALGWLVLLAGARRPGGWWPPTSVRAGMLVVAATVVVGMLARHVAGGGTPVSFVVVATLFLALFLLGWRAVAGRVGARARAR